jgi:hypothetical protein
MLFDVYHNLKPVVALKNALRIHSDAYTNAGTGVYNGRVIDLAGYQGAMILVPVGVLTDELQTFKLQEGPATRIKLSELAVTTTFTTKGKWSFWYKTTLSTEGPIIGFRFVHPKCVNPDQAGHVDITLMPLQSGASSSWAEQPIVSTDASAIFYGNRMADNVSFYAAAGGQTLAQAALAAIAANPLEDTGNWELAGIMVAGYEGTAKTIYIDDITIAGVTFELEEDITDYHLGGFFSATPISGDAIVWSTTSPHAGKSSVKITKAAGGSTGVWFYLSDLPGKLTWVDFSDVSIVYLPGVTENDILGTYPVIAGTDHEKVYSFGYIGKQRYIRVVDTVTAAGGSTGGTLGAIAILGNPLHGPAV